MSVRDKDWLPWFPCNPVKLLGSLAAMSADEKLAYMIVLLRIYELGGPINDDVHALANRTGLKAKRVEAALERLFATEKLIKVDESGFYTNPFAQEEIADQIKRARDESCLQSVRRKNGIKNKKKVEENQQTDVTAGQPMVNPGQPQVTRLHLHEQLQNKERETPDGDPTRHVEKKRNSKPREVKSAIPRSRLPDDWILIDKDREYAKTQGLDDRQIDFQVDAFRAHRNRGKILRFGRVFDPPTSLFRDLAMLPRSYTPPWLTVRRRTSWLRRLLWLCRPLVKKTADDGDKSDDRKTEK